jgi:hypothetical protein
MRPRLLVLLDGQEEGSHNDEGEGAQQPRRGGDPDGQGGDEHRSDDEDGLIENGLQLEGRIESGRAAHEPGPPGAHERAHREHGRPRERGRREERPGRGARLGRQDEEQGAR